MFPSRHWIASRLYITTYRKCVGARKDGARRRDAIRARQASPLHGGCNPQRFPATHVQTFVSDI
ncbi:MAG: hypothetical protein LBM98_02265 [Oscillospiraceae bacterium]|nr:hypothetical protein [Oscillospiraceae bacterium]